MSCPSSSSISPSESAATQDGKPKIFRDIEVTKLREFFQGFKSLNVRSNEQLDTLVSQCEGLVGGVRQRVPSPEQVRLQKA